MPRSDVWPGGSVKNILILENDISLLKSMAKQLKVKPFKVYSANSAPEALNILKNQNIHLLVTDIKTKDCTGKKIFLQEIEKMKIPTIKKLIIVELEHLDKDSLYFIGNHPTIIRPFTSEQLIKKCELILSGSEGLYNSFNCNFDIDIHFSSEQKNIKSKHKLLSISNNKMKILWSNDNFDFKDTQLNFEIVPDDNHWEHIKGMGNIIDEYNDESSYLPPHILVAIDKIDNKSQSELTSLLGRLKMLL